MKQPLIIGITGGIGGGKSTFCRFLKQENQLVYNTDNEAKRIQETDNDVVEAIKRDFGDDIYHNGSLQRSKLASIVFSDTRKLEKLNQIIHPAVIKDFLEWVKKHSDRKFLFMECAILFEAKFSYLVDRVVVVTADKNTRIQRVIKRNNLKEEDVIKRIENQFDENLKIKNADWTFDTTENDLTQKQILKFLKDIKS